MTKNSPRCPTCKVLYNDRVPPEKPPCGQCRVDLLEENDQPGNIYMLTRGQVLMSGMGDIIDINIPAVKTVMDLYGVADQQRCFEKVYKTFHHFLKEQHENS